MSELIDCPSCNNKILSRMGTICPNCSYTVGYFNGEKRRKGYGKLFALTIFAPFFSFFTLVFAQINFYSFILAIWILSNIFLLLFLILFQKAYKKKSIF